MFYLFPSKTINNKLPETESFEKQPHQTIEERL